MSRTVKTGTWSEAGQEWFAALGAPLTAAVEAGERINALEEACLDIDAEIEVYRDRSPSLSDHETLDVLNGLLGQERDLELDPRYCNLRGETLSLPTGNTVVDENVDGCARLSRTSELWYRLVVTDSEMPIGFCTWVFQCEAGADCSDRAVLVEIGEVWLAPQYRAQGIGTALADRVVRLVAEALLELDGRLSGAPLPVCVEVGADVYSASGADFVHRVARVARDQLTTVMGLYFGDFAQLVLQVLPANMRL